MGKIGIKEKCKKIRAFFKKNEFVVTWIGLVVTIISVMFANQNINNVSSKISLYTEINQKTELEQTTNNNDEINNIYAESGSVLINNSQDSNVSVVNNINDNYLNFILEYEENNRIEKALEYAECYFNVGEYETSIKIYTAILQKEQNSLALCNLGYMYANGFGTEEDDAKAFEYYEQAIELGYDRAKTNELALLLRERYVERAEKLKLLLTEGNSTAINFVFSINDISSDKEENINQILNMTNDELIEYLDENYYEEKNMGVFNYTSVPTSDAITRYEKIGSYNWYSQDTDTSGTVYQYRKYCKECKNIYMLREAFVYGFE
jgi:tetratricopeptide (TPR) repeat protein